MSSLVVDLFYDENRAKFRWLRNERRETFYNERSELIEFDTSLEALQWIAREHPEYTKRIKGQQMTFDMKGDTKESDGT
jgi:hypothetical protein